MTQRALARRATISLEAIPGYPPCTAALAAARDLLDHNRTRYKTHAWDGAPTGRFCPVHNWPVFKCPLRNWLSTYDLGEILTAVIGFLVVVVILTDDFWPGSRRDDDEDEA